MKALDSAIESLDQTIRGYDQENFSWDLDQPNNRGL